MSLNLAKELWNISLDTKTEILDKKHSGIVENAKKVKFANFSQNFRNWDSQSDSGIPFQLNIYNSLNLPIHHSKTIQPLY